jgi:hypothetical protein
VNTLDVRETIVQKRSKDYNLWVAYFLQNVYLKEVHYVGHKMYFRVLLDLQVMLPCFIFDDMGKLIAAINVSLRLETT